MDNYTSSEEFVLIFFQSASESKQLLAIVFSCFYLTSILVNGTIITVIYHDKRLHSPLYLFLCNLSILDICYTTVNIPKLIDMLLYQHNTVSFKHCFTQLFFFWGCGSTQDILLFTMACDRYVAICKPLHYHSVFSAKNCVNIIISIWGSGFLNSLLVTIAASKMSFCQSNRIEQFFCDAKALLKISCSGVELFYIVICVELLVFGLSPFLCTVVTYMKIIRVILQIKSKDGRKKAFNTCSSHLTVITIFYATVLLSYMMPPADNLVEVDQAFVVLFTAVIPMVNPVIYSLPNQKIKKALVKLARVPVQA